MVEIFKALSDETRLRILNILGTDKLCVCEIEEVLGISQPNASRHLNKLKSAGIISAQRRSQWIYYYISPEFLSKYGKFWDEASKLFDDGPYLEDKKRLKELVKSVDC